MHARRDIGRGGGRGVGPNNADRVSECLTFIGFQGAVAQCFSQDVCDYGFLYGAQVWHNDSSGDMEGKPHLLCGVA